MSVSVTTIYYSVIVPVFNSAATLEKLVTELRTVMQSTDRRYEIILVDDDSSDKSWETLLSIKKNYPDEVVLIQLGKNAGQFAATFCGVEHARGEVMITIDDDLQYAPSEIKTLLDEWQRRDVVMLYGVPKQKKHSLKTKIYHLMMQLVIYCTAFRYYVPKGYYYSSFRVFKRSTLWKDTLNGIAQHLDIYALWHLHPRHIGFAYVAHQSRKKGVSGQTFRKKSNDALLNTMCVFISPLHWLRFGAVLTLLLTGLPFLVSGPWLHALFMLLGAVILCSLYILGLYVGQLHARSRGYQDYFVLKKLD